MKKRLSAIIIAFAALSLASALRSAEEGAEPGKEQGLKIGAPMPDFSLLDYKGREWKLSTHKGKKSVIITVGSIMCMCGRDALKDLQGIQDKYAGRGLQVVHVNIEPWMLDSDPQYFSRFAQENRIKFPILLDSDLLVSSRFPSDAMPFLCLVDKDGILRFTLTGRPDDYVKQITTQLDKYLPPPRKQDDKDHKSAPEPEDENK